MKGYDKYHNNRMNIYITVYISVGWKVQRLKSSYDDVIYTVDAFFWPMGFKCYNTDERSEWTAKGTMLKNKPHLVTFY